MNASIDFSPFLRSFPTLFLFLSLSSMSAFELQRKRRRNHPFRALVTRRPTSFSGSYLVPRERSFLAIFLHSLKVGRPACPMQFNYCNATPRRATPPPLGIPASVFVVTEGFSPFLSFSHLFFSLHFFSFSPHVLHSRSTSFVFFRRISRERAVSQS